MACRKRKTRLFLYLLAFSLASTAGVACSKELYRFDKHTGAVRAVALSPDGRYLATVGDDKMCHVLDAKTLELVRSYGPHGAPLTGVAFFKDLTVVVSSKRDEKRKASIFFWSWPDRRLVRQLEDSDQDSLGLAVAPDGTKLAVTLGGNAARIYFLDPFERIGLVQPKEEWVTRFVAFSPDSRHLIQGSGGGAFRWLMEAQRRGAAGRSGSEDESTANALAFTPDGTHFLTAHDDHKLRFWNVKTGKGIGWLDGHKAPVTSVDFSPSGKLTVTGSADNTVRVWDILKYQQLKEFDGHTKEVTSVVFLDGDEDVVSAGLDGTVRLWSLSESRGDTPLAHAGWLRRSGRFAAAAREYAHLMEAAQKKSGRGHPDTLAMARLAAEAYRAGGNFEEAAELYLQCYKLSEPSIKPDQTDVPRDLPDLARVYLLAGESRKAERGLTRVLEERKARLGAEHPGVADLHFALGQLFKFQNDSVSAVKQFEASLEIRQATLPRNHPDLAESLLRLAIERFHRHEMEGLGELYKQALEIREALYERPDPRIHEVESHHAEYLIHIGQVDEGKKLHDSLIREAITADDQESLPAIRVQFRYAEILTSYGDYAGAERYLKVIRQRAMRSLGPNHPDMPLILGNLAGCYLSLKRYPESIDLFLEAVSMVESQRGPDNLVLSYYLTNLGIAYGEAGEVEKAEATFRRCINIQDNAGFAQSFITRINLAGLLHSQKRTVEALSQFDKAYRGMREQIVRALPVVPRGAQSYYARLPTALADFPLSAARELHDNQKFVDRSAEWILNTKGLAVEATAERELAARDSTDPETGILARDLVSVRNQLATLANPAGGFVSGGPSAQTVKQLWDTERAILARIGEKSKRRRIADEWTTLEDVQDQLKKDEALVEVFGYRRYDFRAGRSYELRYCAWIIPATGQGKVKLVDLGEVGRIESLVTAYRRAMQQSLDLLATRSEVVAEEHLNRATTALSDRIIRPIESEISDFERLLISPAGSLWVVPWSAMLTADGKYVIEKHEVTMIHSGRELLNKAGEFEPKRPVIVASPDYDFGIPSNATPGTPFGKLKYTAVEADLITPSITKFTKVPVLSYRDKMALENTVKSVSRPQILVFSTHGYFDETPWWSEDRMPPLVRCGVALTGANSGGPSTALQGTDGVLTGLEVLSMDLRGTELVVLSACDTGLGDETHSEGVAGLRQAFHLAGAETVIATFWSIPDGDSMLLVSNFFEELARSGSKGEAFRRAQLDVVKGRRTRHKAAHPYYWAGFGISGSGR